MSALKERFALQIRHQYTAFGDFYSGRREALIEARLAQPEWFAGIGERRSGGDARRLRSRSIELAGGAHVRLRRIRGTLYFLGVYVCEEERELRERQLGWGPIGSGITGFEIKRTIDLRELRAARADEAFGRFLARALGRAR